MQKCSLTHILHLFLLCGIAENSFSQKVGILTTQPQAPFHIASSGLMNTPGGLVILGDTSEGHLAMDYDLLQSLDDNTPLPLRLQPMGGNLSVGTSLMFLNASNGFIGLGTITPDQKLELEGSANQFLRVHTTSAGASQSGLELLRSSEFNGTDWRIMNDGGVLRFYDGIDNFLTAGDLNLMMTSSGNLGLGIDPPASHLHVAGATDQFITVHRTTAGTGMAGIDLLRDNEFSATDWRIVNDGGVFKIFDAINNFTGAADLNMTITAGGNVGIGIAAPESPLHIVGTQFISGTGDGFLQIGSPTSTHVRFDNNEILARNGDLNSLLYFQYWGGNLSLCDDDAGRVGIGTSSPLAKLHVIDGADVTLGGGGQLVLGTTTSTNIAMDGNEIQARSNGSASALFLQNSGGDVLLVPNATSQVGIGILSSANMPDDDYLLAVDGRIISEEVRVEISSSWPDYVFAKEYHLTPLDELENHIYTYGHLPGMPTAAEVKDEGILLGDMNRALLEKVEELTLYVIALQKEIDQLKNTRK